MKSNNNCSEVDDKYCRRLWPPNCTKKRWEIITKSEIIEKQRPHIFLVDKPLTFGHSQLVVPNLKEMSEKKLFEEASKYIRDAISLFNEIFLRNDSPIHEQNDFGVLAECTNTNGDYIKMLILKASADEELKKAYKVHLVPYFKSHEKECKKQYQCLHGIRKSDAKGGLLGWLGKREYEVDSWELIDDIVKDHLKLPALAKILRDKIINIKKNNR